MSVTKSFLTSSKTDFVERQSELTTVRHMAGYGISVALGMLSGVLSTALVMMAAIVIQLVLLQATVFAPGMIFFAGTAIAVGFSISWLMGKGCRHLLPNLFNQANGYEVLIVTVVGTVTALIQTTTFMFI